MPRAPTRSIASVTAAAAGLALAAPRAHAQQSAAPAPDAQPPAVAAEAPVRPAAAPAVVVAPSPPAPPARPPQRMNAAQLDLGLAVVGLAYERLFGERFGVQLEAQIFGTWFGPTFGLPDLSGFGGQIRPTLFLLGVAPEGLYVAPYLRVDRVSATVGADSGSGVGWSAGLFAGYSFVVANVLNLRVGGGAQYMDYAVTAGATRVELRTFFPALDLVAGLMF